jgi:metallophosphoesterase superfamily enzyme
MSARRLSQAEACDYNRLQGGLSSRGLLMYRFASEWILTPYRLAVHEPTRTAVVADPHLGYNDARRGAGDAVPMLSLDEQLMPLTLACSTLDLAGLVVAGDLCEACFTAEIIDRFLAVVAERRLTLRAIVPGNHDRGSSEFRDRLPLFTDGFSLGAWSIVHGDRTLPTGPVVMGHVHPAWRHVQRVEPCYLVGPNRLVLPAFSRDAAGGPVNHAPRWSGHQALSIEGKRVVDRGIIRANKNPRRSALRGFRR